MKRHKYFIIFVAALVICGVLKGAKSQDIVPEVEIEANTESIRNEAKSLAKLENFKISKDVEGNCAQRNKFVEVFQLPPNYHKHEFPTARNTEKNCSFEKIPIRVSLRIRNIRGIDDLNEELKMELDLITIWTDYILKDMLENVTESDVDAARGTNFISLESSYINQLWLPDIIFNKAISITKPAVHSSRINHKPSRLRIWPDGEVQLYSRLLVTLYCPMDFTYFPADTQTCNINLRSYSFSDDDIVLSWQTVSKQDGTFYSEDTYNEGKTAGIYEVPNRDDERPLVFLYGRSHPNYRIYLHSIDTENRTEKDADDNDEYFTLLRFKISVKRKLTFHMTQTFTPILFLVLITWLTFLIPLSNLEARIGVAMTTLLTMTNKFSEVRTYTPNVSYISAIDIYMLVSISMVFITLLEFTFLYWVRLGRSEYYQSRMSLKPKLPRKSRGNPELDRETSMVEDRFYWEVRNYVEVYGFLFTVIGYTLFNVFFWPWIFLSSNYFYENVDPHHNSV